MSTSSSLEMMAEDISTRKNVEAQLRQVQKIEAVGRLTAGIAHDFNNILTVILSDAELIADALRSLGLLDEAKKEWSERGPILIAGVYAVLGEKDQAFAWLEKSYAARETGIVQLKSPQRDSLRDDPRFQDLLRRMNFPEN